MQRMHKVCFGTRHTNCTFLYALGLAGVGGASGISPIGPVMSMLPLTPASGSGFTSWSVADLRKITSNARRILCVNNQNCGYLTAILQPDMPLAYSFGVM